MNDNKKRAFVFKEILDMNVDIACIQETHCALSEMDKWKAEWTGESHWNRGTSHARGVATLFRPGFHGKVTEEQMDFNGRILILTIEYDNNIFKLANVYAPNTEDKMECNYFFEEVHQDLSPEHLNILCGDHNMVEDIYLDRTGGNPREKHTWGIDALREMKTTYSLFDPWRYRFPNKKQYTRVAPGEAVKSRLDRFYITNTLLPLLNSVDILPFVWSDHDIVLMNVTLPKSTPRGPNFWKLNVSLLEDKHYKDMISEFWREWRTRKDEYQNLQKWWDFGKIRVRTLTIDYATWKNREKRKEKRELLKTLREERQRETENIETITKIRQDLRTLAEKEAGKMFISTKMAALEHGEKPTKYFFDLLKKTQTKNSLSEIYVENPDGTKTTTSDPGKILKESTEFYKKLYTAEMLTSRQEQQNVLAQMDSTLSEELRQALTVPFTKKELREALWDTKANKTPGYDGIPYDFYKMFWSDLEDDFLQLLNFSLNDEKRLSNSQMHAIISLLYKSGDNKDLKNWRPISLLCCDYKIIAKILANRLKNTLSSIIHGEQTCAVPGRDIHANLFLTRDIIQYTEQKGIKGYILTVDQEKAFDKVDRELLFQICEKLGIGNIMIDWIRVLYNNTSSALQVNGFIGERFKTTRGIRQGCPLSAILFVIYSEFFGTLVRNDPKIIGLNLPGTKDKITLSQYADDNVFFLSSRTNLIHVFSLLDRYRQLTGSNIKASKTAALCLGGQTPQLCGQEINWRNNDGLETLGITFFTDPLRTINYNWTKTCDELKQEITTAQKRDLSFRGKVLFLSSMILAGAWFLATIYSPPPWVATSLYRVLFAYLWGEGKMEAIKRETILQPKDKGGLGLDQPIKKSIALRTKYFHQVVNENCNLKWVFLARYYTGFQIARLKEEWGFLRNNLVPKPDKDISPQFYSDIVNFLRTTDITKLEWNTRYIYNAQIAKNPHIPKAVNIWPTLRTIQYAWPNTWENCHYSQSPGKYQELHYKILHLALPTRESMARWKARGATNPHCMSCRETNQNIVETHLHIFVECKQAYNMWKLVEPIIQLLQPDKPTQCFYLIMGIYQPGVPMQMKKLIATVVQLTLHQIWLNRNIVSMDKKRPDLRTSLNKIKTVTANIVTNIYRKMRDGNNLVNFRKNYCDNNKLITLDITRGLKCNFPT